MPQGGHQGQTTWLADQSAGNLGGGSGEVATNTYMPRMVNPEYLLGEGPSPFPGLGWEASRPEARGFPEPPGGFADPFSDDDGGVRSISQEQAYANPEL